jgi:hypothetical protein
VRPKQEGARLNAGTRFGPLDRKCRQPYVDCAAPLCVSHSADKPLRKEKGRILQNCREIASIQQKACRSLRVSARNRRWCHQLTVRR